MYVVLFQALGDNLISLSLLKQLDEKINILGTKHTKDIIELLNIQDKFLLNILYDEIPAFYDVRKKGFFHALKDFLFFIFYIKKHKIKSIVLEKKDFRSSLIYIFTRIKIHTPDKIYTKIYEQRQRKFSEIFQQNIFLENYVLEINNPKIILINPLTRTELRNIKKTNLDYIIKILKKENYKIYLLDYEKKYVEYMSDVDKYFSDTTINDVYNLIKECDLYIGGDSFLIHLAYYLKKNYFIVFYRDNNDFLPPNIKEGFLIEAHKSIDFNKQIFLIFSKIGLVL